MLRLNPGDQEQLRKAILGAYPGFGGVNKLTAALAAADIDISRYFAGFGGGIEDALFNAILDLNAQGRSTDVIGAVRRGNSGDPALAELEGAFLRTVAAPETARLEGMIVEQLQYQPAPDWAQRLQQAFGWVCRVERADDGKALATGFLVADNLVLTNYHVLFGAPGTVAPKTVQLRFDAVDDTGGRVVIPHATPQPVEKSPPGGAEWGAVGDPSSTELDFALIRLSERIGAEQTPAGARRGHATLDVGAAATDARRPLVILEHPKGAPLQICIGSITGSNAARTRIRHNATTQDGSSGSPCLSMELKVVALHNGGVGTTYNTAVPISGVQTMLQQRNVAIG